MLKKRNVILISSLIFSLVSWDGINLSFGHFSVSDDTSNTTDDKGNNTDQQKTDNKTDNKTEDKTERGDKETETTNTYLVTFKLDEETTLAKDTVEHGKKPKYNDVVPTKDELTEGNYTTTYTFDGWNKDKNAQPSDAIKIDNLPAVIDKIIYFAIFSSTKVSNNEYIVRL